MTTILILILVLWALGFGIGTGGSLIHLLLVVALIVFLLDLIQRRRPLD